MPACGRENRAAAKFCDECGGPLKETVGDAHLGRGERRLVTVLFADVSGFTALGETLDPEVLRNLMATCFDRLVPAITYGGCVPATGRRHVRKRTGRELETAADALRVGDKKIRSYPTSAVPLLRLHGTHDWLSGQERRARRRWQQSLDVAERLGCLYQGAQTRLEMGNRLGDRALADQGAARTLSDAHGGSRG